MDDTAVTVVGGALGGAGLFGIAIKVWGLLNQTTNAAKTADLGSAYQQHMYARLKDLETREQALQKTILVQTETIGSLKREIIELRADLTEAQEKYKEAKKLLDTMTQAYTKAQGDLVAFEQRMANQGIQPTGMLPQKANTRPWIPGGNR